MAVDGHLPEDVAPTHAPQLCSLLVTPIDSLWVTPDDHWCFFWDGTQVVPEGHLEMKLGVQRELDTCQGGQRRGQGPRRSYHRVGGDG